jgi:hypothetical protein
VKGYVFGFIFMFLATVNIFSVIKTITTPPGGIPEEREWDMVSEMDGHSDMDSEDERKQG